MAGAEATAPPEGAQELLDGTHGERIPKPSDVIRRGDDGRYTMQSMSAGQYARLR
jgi:hypothetical protein